MHYKFKLATCLLLVIVSSMLLGTVAAHELRPAIADIRTGADPLQIELRVNLEAIIAGIGPEHQNTEDAEQAMRYQQLRAFSARELQEQFNKSTDDFLNNLSVENNDGQRLVLHIANLDIPSRGDVRVPRDTRITIAVKDSDITESIRWQWAEQLGPLIIRADNELAKLDATHSKANENNHEGFTQYLTAGARSDAIALRSTKTVSSGSSFADYLFIGIEHIIPKGLDHILFVIGLFLLAPAVKPVFWQISMFTLAHTLTLALGVTGIINPPATIIEPLIALSITAICLENVFRRKLGRSRLLLVFVFGLLHGLGFAGVLGEVGLPQGQFASSLLAFNIGVEVGQLMVVLACAAATGWWANKKACYRTLVAIPGSLVISAIGLFWFMQRIELIA